MHVLAQDYVLKLGFAMCTFVMPKNISDARNFSFHFFRYLLGKIADLSPHLIVACGQIIYAVWYILGHLVLSGENSSDPLGFAFAREIIATVALLTISKSVEGE